MLELCKEILTKVSFDKFLFIKELKKAIQWCKDEEVLNLRSWCLNQFGNLYQKEIVESFKAIG